MRCFIAIDLPGKVKQEISKVQEEVKKQENVRIKFVKKENLHLTLKFLGEISNEKVNKIKNELKKLKFKKFKTKINDLGVFPSENFIRVLWIALKPSDEIKKLRKKIENSLYILGFKHDKKFEPHITLARIKFIKNRKNFLKSIKKIKSKKIEFEINSFALKKSILTRKGPIYENIVKFNSL